MGVAFRGFDIGMAHRLLKYANIGAVFQHGGGEAVAQGMTDDPLVDPGSVGRPLKTFRIGRFQLAGMRLTHQRNGYIVESIGSMSVPYGKHSGDSAGPHGLGPLAEALDWAKFRFTFHNIFFTFTIRGKLNLFRNKQKMLSIFSRKYLDIRKIILP